LVDNVMAKKKKQRLPRLSITLPTDLRRQMRRLDGEVNWSAVAAEAFQRKLEELKAVPRSEPESPARLRTERLDGTSMEEGIEDPKLLRERDLRRGREGGRIWAENEATPAWFARLEAVAGRVREFCVNGDFSEDAVELLTPLLDDLFLRFVGKRDWNRQTWLWSRFDSVQHTFPDPSAPPAYIQGFVLGAMDVWEKSREKVTAE
jgi:hypothetical protein